MLIPKQADFNSSAARIIYNVSAMRAEFNAVDSDTVSETAQRQFYDFMTGAIHRMFQNPEIIGLIIEPDETENNPHPHRKYKPNTHKYLETRKLLRKNQKILSDFFDTLEWLGSIGEEAGEKLMVPMCDLVTRSKNKPKQKKLLDTLRAVGFDLIERDGMLFIGCDAYPQMCCAWRLLSDVATADKDCRTLVNVTSNDNNNRIFARHVYDVPNDDIFEILYRHINEDARDHVRSFFEYLKSKGFDARKIACSPFGESENIDIQLAQTKTYTDPTLQKNESFILHIRAIYELRWYRPLSFRLLTDRAPFYILHHRFDQLPAHLQDFTVKYSGTCRGEACGFCVQMNREAAAKREKPFNYNTVNYQGVPMNLCYYFKHVDMKGEWNEEKTTQVFEFDGSFIQTIIDLYEWFDCTLAHHTK